MLELIFIIPFLLGISLLFLPVKIGRRILLLTGIIHLPLSLMAWQRSLTPFFANYFNWSPEGMLVLLATSFLFLLIALYAIFYLKEVEVYAEPVFLGALLFFLSAMSMAAVSEHLVVLWIAIEATTLTSAPLILLHKSKNAVEATWKYVLICSVGIALALLGNFFVVFAAELGGVHVPLTFSNLAEIAPRLNPVWLTAGFIFVLVGYGTKMGLAPMHSWLPDAHSEAPSPASALLSGALLNCAFLGIYKLHVLLGAAGIGASSSAMLVVFGLLSMLVSAIFIIKQKNYKRMLAYSSIENMGVIAFGVGIGGLACFGAMLHLLHHSLIKSSLFLSSGNILLGCASKHIHEAGRLIKVLPRTCVAFFAGFVGISGLPPFGLFLSELCIIMGAVQKGRIVPAIFFCLALVMIVAGLSRHVLRMSFGGKENEILLPEKAGLLVSPYLLLAASIALTVFLPDSLLRTINHAVTAMGGLHG